MPDAPTPITSSDHSRRLLVWGEVPQFELLREVAILSGSTIATVSAPSVRDSTALGELLGVDREDDLRVAVLRDDIDLILLTSSAPLERDLRRAIVDRGLPVLSLQPRPACMSELDFEHDWTSPALTPLLRLSSSFVAAAEVMQYVNSRRLVSVVAASGERSCGTLFARLYDAVEVSVALLGRCEAVAATCSLPSVDVPEEPGQLHGEMSVMLRFANDAGATLALSEGGGRWRRNLSLFGEGGRLDVSDDGFEWFETGATSGDRHLDELPAAMPAAAIAYQIERAWRNGESSAPMQEPSRRQVMAVCEAARLSAKTGATEDPRKVAELLSHL